VSTKRYFVSFQGYYNPSPDLCTREEARIILAEARRDAVAECRRKYGKAVVRGDKDYYDVSFGANLYSCASVVEA
jgi:hypothetical protein